VRDELRFLNIPEDPIPGDAFLKYLSSVYVFVTNPALHEGALHVVRQQIISNKSLLQNAIRVGLPSFIQSKPFTIKLWQPPNFSLAPILGTQSPIEGADDDNSADDYDAMKTTGQGTSEKAAAASQPDSSKATGPTAHSQDPGFESPLAEASKSKKRSKKKRQQDEQNYQWFGDKVSVPHIS
jgi:endoribonuclease Dicer